MDAASSHALDPKMLTVAEMKSRGWSQLEIASYQLGYADGMRDAWDILLKPKTYSHLPPYDPSHTT